MRLVGECQPGTAVAASASRDPSTSPLFFLTDLNGGQKYLIDTGAEVSVLPAVDLRHCAWFPTRLRTCDHVVTIGSWMSSPFRTATHCRISRTSRPTCMDPVFSKVDLQWRIRFLWLRKIFPNEEDIVGKSTPGNWTEQQWERKTLEPACCATSTSPKSQWCPARSAREKLYRNITGTTLADNVSRRWRERQGVRSSTQALRSKVAERVLAYSPVGFGRVHVDRTVIHSFQVFIYLSSPGSN